MRPDPGPGVRGTGGVTRILPSILVLLALSATPALSQGPRVPGGGSLLEWMGLEPGESLVYEIDGKRTCVTVGEPFRIDGRSFAALTGLEWPGLASDSRILVPLDGSLSLAVIATPGPRPNSAVLVPAPETIPSWAGTVEAATSSGSEGWFAAAGSRDEPRFLVHTWCEACMDAGTTVVLERGKGIRSVTRTTIAGPETLRRIDDEFCAERQREGGEIELQIYVLPDDERER